MSRRATLRRIVVCALVVSGLTMPVSAHAESQANRETKLARMQMPGRPFRKRNPLSLDAVKALSLIMRTENIDDPLYVDARKVVSDKVAVIMKLDAARLHTSWTKAPRDHQIAVLAALTQLNVRYIEGKEEDFDFDTQWHTEGELTEFGYIVKIAIPFKSLRFATEAAITILRIDDMIKLNPKEDPNQ